MHIFMVRGATMNKHINYTMQQDFFTSLNTTADGNTPYIIVDGFGALSYDVYATTHDGLVAYWLDDGYAPARGND